MSKDKKFYSASSLAKRLGVEYSDLVRALLLSQYVMRGADRKLVLTNEGIAAGAKMGSSDKYGPFIQWPEGLNVDVELKTPTQNTKSVPQTSNNRNANTKNISSRTLAKRLNLDANYLNDIACVLGWASKASKVNGYLSTNLGLKEGISHGYSSKYNMVYLLFPHNILTYDKFNNCVEIFKHLELNNIGLYTGTVECVQTMAVDGHIVNSIYHCIIDNWLLFYGITHIINSRNPFPNTDFFLPELGLSIKFNMDESTESIPIVDETNGRMITFNPNNIIHIDIAMKKALFTLRI
ncbi:hypothetical protein [Photobacterium iliopiscarium]|uniref:hypothetical protein n=1 Tax=Photobacterium iliopiscarium TaxID=56192 RepID=UPI001E476FAA|nr:hypothetical protein [Photobacterium iliopiscarium]MCD9485912.1 hypothetical protein [Photobacterium iliopiscarium]MCF2242609.1 hypothetical protein [Photobacterium iliopiscarium]